MPVNTSKQQTPSQKYYAELRRRRLESEGLQRNLSVDDVCAAVGISRSYFYKLVSQGRGPRVKKLGHKTIITRSDFDAWEDSFANFESRAA